MLVRFHGTTAEEKAPIQSDAAVSSEERPEDQGRIAAGGLSETLVESAQEHRDIPTGGDTVAQENDGAQNISLGKLNNLIATDVVNLENGQHWILTCQ